MAANPCDELIVDLSRVDVDVEISGPPCIDVDWLQTDITIEAITVANQGPKGEKGDPGEDGESIVGPSGPPGSPGIAASVDAGTTTTGDPGTDASVENSGTSSTAIFDFTIPRGDKGDKGDIGQGILIKGSVPNHASLPATGNTPGDVWVTSDTSHGWAWNGTAWVDIGPIQGPPGATGPSGADGSDGAPGAPGAPGAAATVAAGPTVTSAPGTNAAVINTGSSSAAVFAFTIPRGDVGQQGPAGTPGSIGIDGAPGAPGAPGAAGGNAWTLVTNASFTVPAYGANVTVQAGDTSWVALGEWVYVDDAGGAGIAGQLVVTAKTPTTLTLFNPPLTTYPLASASADGLLRKVSGNTTDFIDGTNNSQPVSNIIPPGTVWDTARATAPSGWILCDGTSYPTATYPALFSAIGYVFGGSGANFNVPDCRGRVGVGAGQGASLTNRVLAAKGGEESHILTIAELAAHTHADAGHNHTGFWGQVGNLTVTGGAYPVDAYPVGQYTSTSYASLSNTGSNTAHNTMPPFIALNKIIKT